jgi:(p)ppGpp synthase/HD superfamily hydrolase
VLGERTLPEFVRGLPKTRAAVVYADQLHDRQRRQVDGAPFILHPLEVATLLYQSGAPDHVIAAGALHDTLEKTDTAPADLARRFGPRVTALVQAVTEDERVSGYADRKAALRDQVAGAGREAMMVFAADKLSKVRELRLAGTSLTPVRRRRLKHYRACLQLLQTGLADFPLVPALQAELEALPDPVARERPLASAG